MLNSIKDLPYIDIQVCVHPLSRYHDMIISPLTRRSMTL
jgi:hypothetical protein